MNRPSFLVRFAGSPPVAIVLVLASVAAIYDWWYVGHVQWLLAFVAFAVAIRTLRSVGTVRRYNAWFAQWQAMGGQSAVPLPQKKPKRRSVVALEAIGCGAVALAIIAYSPQGQKTPDALVVLWLVAVAGCVWKLAELLLLSRRSRQALASPREAQGKKAVKDDAVAWVLERAASSPSRQDAESNLPEQFTVQHLPSATGQQR